MKERNGILTGLMAACAVCVISTASYSQSPQQIGITSGRAEALVAAAVGLISLIIGGLALARASGRIGNGNGRAAAIVALVLGLLGVSLGGLALARSRRSRSTD